MQKYSKKNFLNWDLRKSELIKVHFEIFLYFPIKTKKELLQAS